MNQGRFERSSPAATAPAWRWHPDELSRVLASTDFAEEWRIINRPDAVNRFPGVHILAPGAYRTNTAGSNMACYQ
jgi:hypothetical protein